MNKDFLLPKDINELYAGDDMDELFKGGFINFGYWDKGTLTKDHLSDEDVVKANKSLCRLVFDELDLKTDDKVLEVGCGFGSVSAYLLKLHGFVKSVTGIDRFLEHVNKSIARNKELVESGKLNFKHSLAEEISFDDNSFDKIVSIEAFQHFVPNKSILEFSRVLKDTGILVLSTLFVKKGCFEKVFELLPKPAVVPDNCDLNFSIDETVEFLKKSNFSVDVFSIGDAVWEGYNKWVIQQQNGIWDKNWMLAYENNLLDYFVIKAVKI